MVAVTPRVDIAFKKLFGVEENKDLLISLINSIVSKNDQVASVELLNPYNPRNFKKDKLSILDIKARSHEGKLFNIEIQISDEEDYDKRALYYWGKLYTSQMERGLDYSSLQKTIGIHILNFTSIPNSKKYHNAFNLREKVTNLHFFHDIELHTIELKKFEGSSGLSKVDNSEKLQKFVSKIKTALERWLTFLSRSDLLDRNKLPKELSDPNLAKALSVIEEMNFTKMEREAYEEHLKWLRVEANTLRKTENEAYKRGEIKGREEEKMEIAKNLIKQGLSIESIASATGLSINEIKKQNI